MERFGPKKIETEALKILAVISLNLGGCTPPAEVAAKPSETRLQKPPTKELPPPEQEYRENVERSWAFKEARKLTREELTEEGLTLEELPLLLEELSYSFSDDAEDPVIIFHEPFFEDGIKIRFKGGELPKDKQERALQQLKRGVDRGQEGARMSTVFLDTDESASVFCTFKASPSVLPGTFPFIPDKRPDLFGYSSVLSEDLCQNEFGQFSLSRQSLITFRATLPDSAAQLVQDNENIPSNIKPKLIEELFFFSLYLSSDHEIIGHPAAYRGRGFKNIDVHSQNEKSFMNVSGGGGVNITDIPSDYTSTTADAVIVKEEDETFGLWSERAPASNDIAYKTMRLKRILYNKFIRNKPKSILQSSTNPQFFEAWKKIPE